MAIVRRHRPADRFVQISNDAVEDSRLSFRARGVLAYLLSRPEGWTSSAEDLTRLAPEGRDAIRKALQELRMAGYLVRVKVQDKQGRWVTDTYVEDFPIPDAEHPTLL